MEDKIDEMLLVYENTLAVAMQIDGNATRLKALKKCREQAKAAIQNLLLEARKEERSLALMYLHGTNKKEDYKRKLGSLNEQEGK